MNILKAVFWDVDGTIADTELYGHRLAFNQAFKSMDIPWEWDKKTYVSLLSIQGGVERIKYFAASRGLFLNESIISKLHILKQENYAELVKGGNVKLRPGVSRLILELKNLAVSQYIVTMSSKRSVETLIQNSFNYSIDFDGYITSEDIQKSKPDPSCYLEAISRSSFKINNILAIEDSLKGLQAAFSAELKTLITPSPWINKVKVEDYKLATAIVNKLGDSENHTQLLKGPPLEEKFVSISYLTRLINL